MVRAQTVRPARYEKRDAMTGFRSLVRTPLLQESPLSRYRSASEERRLLHDHVVLISEGEGDAVSNFAAVFGPLAWDELRALASDFFKEGTFEIVIESNSADSLESYLVPSGWTCVEEEIAMVLPALPATTPNAPPDLEIIEVATPESFEDYMAVVPGNREWVPNLDAATDPSVGLFVGYVEGEPVATARLTCYGDVAEVTGVQTLDSHRRRGYGTALTWAAIREAGQRGCTTIILTASEMGYPLYVKMGFQEVCSYRSYEPP